MTAHIILDMFRIVSGMLKSLIKFNFSNIFIISCRLWCTIISCKYFFFLKIEGNVRVV